MPIGVEQTVTIINNWGLYMVPWFSFCRRPTLVRSKTSTPTAATRTPPRSLRTASATCSMFALYGRTVFKSVVWLLFYAGHTNS